MPHTHIRFGAVIATLICTFQPRSQTRAVFDCTKNELLALGTRQSTFLSDICIQILVSGIFEMVYNFKTVLNTPLQGIFFSGSEVSGYK